MTVDQKISVATDTTPPLSTDTFPLARAGDNTARKISVGNFLAGAPATVFANKHTFPGMTVGAGLDPAIGAPITGLGANNAFLFKANSLNNIFELQNIGAGAPAFGFWDVNGIELGAIGYGSHTGTPHFPFCDMVYISTGGGTTVANGGHPTSFAVVNDNFGMLAYVQLLLTDLGKLEYRLPSSTLSFSIDATTGIGSFVQGLTTGGAIVASGAGDSSFVGKLGVGVAAPGAKLHVKDLNAEVRIESTLAGDTGIHLVGSGGQAWWVETGRADLFDQAASLGIWSANKGAVVSINANTGFFGILTAAPTSPLQVVGLATYINNAAAVAAGLTAGAFYRNNADPDVLCVVH